MFQVLTFADNISNNGPLWNPMSYYIDNTRLKKIRILKLNLRFTTLKAQKKKTKKPVGVDVVGIIPYADVTREGNANVRRLR